jgi:acyl carrier protein
VRFAGGEAIAELDRARALQVVQDVLRDVLNLDRTPQPEDRLVEDLGAESVDVISLLFEFEERLGKRIPDSEVGSLNTVGDVVDRVLDAPSGGGP